MPIKTRETPRLPKGDAYSSRNRRSRVRSSRRASPRWMATVFDAMPITGGGLHVAQASLLGELECQPPPLRQPSDRRANCGGELT